MSKQTNQQKTSQDSKSKWFQNKNTEIEPTPALRLGGNETLTSAKARWEKEGWEIPQSAKLDQTGHLLMAEGFQYVKNQQQTEEEITEDELSNRDSASDAKSGRDLLSETNSSARSGSSNNQEASSQHPINKSNFKRTATKGTGSTDNTPRTNANNDARGTPPEQGEGHPNNSESDNNNANIDNDNRSQTKSSKPNKQAQGFLRLLEEMDSDKS